MNQSSRRKALDVTQVFDASSTDASTDFSMDASGRILEEGERLGRFTIKRQLGLGGMGVVYLAHDPDLDREVAIKVLTESVSDDEASQIRFRAEAQAAGNLNHPNVVAVYEIGDDGGSPYIVMEYVPNGSVTDLLEAKSPLDLVEATRITLQATRGIAAAHEKGLIHRDIKPANLMVGSDQTIKVTDFGLARACDRRSDANVTQEGQILGTPFFMSPEQCRGEKLDARSDLYSIGASYFMLLTGVSPFQHAGSTMAILAAHINERPPDPKQLNASVPAPCVRIIHRLLAKSPDDRYQTSESLIEDMTALLKVVKDPSTAKEVRYRGTVHQKRETFDLPSEVTGTMSRIVDSGGTLDSQQRSDVGNDTTANEKSRSRSWLGRRSKSVAKQKAPDASTIHSVVDQPTAQIASEKGTCQEQADSPQKKSSLDGYRKEVFSVNNGRFILRWPEEISESEAAEAEEWLIMLGKKLRRVASEKHD